MKDAIIYQPGHLHILHTIRDQAIATEMWRLAAATTLLIDEIIGASTECCHNDIMHYLDTLTDRAAILRWHEAQFIKYRALTDTSGIAGAYMTAHEESIAAIHTLNGGI